MEEEITYQDLEKNVAVIGNGDSQSIEVKTKSLTRLEGLHLEPQQSNFCPINVLQDKDLLSIFMYLPPYDRLIVSEVCTRWHEISRFPWLDVASLDLTHIPDSNIRAIINLCPKLKEVFALAKRFSHSELCTLARIPLSSLKLYICASGAVSGDEEVYECWCCNLLALVFSDRLRSADWEELVLNHFEIPTAKHWFWREEVDGCDVPGEPDDAYTFLLSGEHFPASLQRLQLSDIHVTSLLGDPQVRAPTLAYSQLLGFTHLQNLTSFILISSRRDFLSTSDFIRDLQALQNLRELYLGSFLLQNVWLNFDIAALGLPRLEVLFIHNVTFGGHRPVGDEPDLVPLVTEHPALRILCITGWYPSEHVIPVRRLFPNGFAAKPVPLLHIFLGKMAAEKIVFDRSSPDALKVYPITEPLPTFLEKAEIAPIFKGVWIAQQVKDDAKYGCNSIHDPNEGADDVSIRVVEPE